MNGQAIVCRQCGGWYDSKGWLSGRADPDGRVDPEIGFLIADNVRCHCRNPVPSVRAGFLAEGGAALIAHERWRQIDVARHTADRDDTYHRGELAEAAVCYAMAVDPDFPLMRYWPWNFQQYKPTTPEASTPMAKTAARITDLTTAGALIAAEIDRLLRLQQSLIADRNHKRGKELASAAYERGDFDRKAAP